MTQERFTIEFHPGAATRFEELGQEVLSDIQSFPAVTPPRTSNEEIHSGFQIDAQDIIGEINVEQSSVNLVGEQNGYYWESKGVRVGWEGPQFKKIKDLAQRLETAAKGRVSYEFLLKHVLKWLREKLELKRADALTDYVAAKCTAEIRDYEIWIPVYRTFSVPSLTLGVIELRTLSKSILDQWFSKLFPNGQSHPGAEYVVMRDRANLQGSLAACIKVLAEREKARQIAHLEADEGIGLLRFLSPINWTYRLVSHCAPVGKENTQQTTEFFFENGEIRHENRAWIEQGPIEWSIDEARQRMPGVFESLQNLASDRNGTEFRRVLYHALQLHSRHTIAPEAPHKIVFVTAAIESLLLKDSSEPIQKNLGERMAFIITNELKERKNVVRNVENFYRVRSRLFHHGENISSDDTEVIDQFFLNVWVTFARLLTSLDLYKTKSELITALEEKKLS